MPSFIETQFPIARLSAESYKERKANNGQTLTRLGKWWGRKQLILVRASILGMPASADAKKDREIFLKVLTRDDDGAWQRCKPNIQRKTSRSAFAALS
jgi:putative DNA methylase